MATNTTSGKESVWDYPRPPRVESTSRRVRVIFNGETIAESRQAKRVLETSHPPVYYLPPEDVRKEVRERIKVLGRGGGYICGPDHSIQKNIPAENIIALFDEARKCC